MKIAVCVKVIEGELNPFDECALEEALRIEGAEVSVISMCPPSTADKLRSLTRLGVKNVTLITDRAFAGSDTLATAYILSKQLARMDFDLVFCGRQTIDGDTAQVGPCLATMMGLGLITNVMKIESIGDEITCQTRLGTEKARLPALLTVERINTLRFPSIRSRLGEIETVDNSVLCADTSKTGLSGSPTKVLKVFENASGFRKCRMILPTELRALLASLPATEKGEEVTVEGGKKLPEVWAIGTTVVEKAKAIADKVILIEETDPVKIAERAKAEGPSVILWNADLWGRKNAPIVSALLQTGLCADCTALETDGEKLFMYRPAKSGNIIAKIECRTLPQMATVRCAVPSDDVIVAGGRGVQEQFDKVESFAMEIGAAVAASRPVVDKNLVPYEYQVGLTGKNISPRVYIAIGISGAVQHTCAIENAGVIIAVNPDKDAPIFRYADYGILSTLDELLASY